MAGQMIWGGRGAGGGKGADRPVEPAWPGAEPVSSFIMLRPWGVQCTLHVSWSLGACHRLLRSGRWTYTPVCTCCGPYVRTYVRIILYYDQTVGRTLHVARVVVRTYVRVSLYYDQIVGRTLHSVRVVVGTSISPSVRPSVIIILYYDQTVGCTLHSVRVVARPYVRIILYYDQTVGCTLHSVRVVVRTYVRVILYYDQTVMYTALCTCCGPYLCTCHPSLRPGHGAYTPRGTCCGPYVRIILEYDQTVGGHVRTYAPSFITIRLWDVRTCHPLL